MIATAQQQTFETTTRYRELEDAVWLILSTRNRGDVLSFDEITAATGLEPHSEGWNHLISNRIRRRMRNDRKINLEIIDHGSRQYKLLTDRESATVLATKNQRRIHRQCNRALKKAAVVNASSLSVAERLQHNANIECLKRSRKAARAGVKSVAKPIESMPRRKVPA